MKSKKQRGTGLIVQPDDMDIGQFFAVHSTKADADQPVQIAGMAFKLTAMNLPFCIGKLVCDPAHPPVTFDTRFLRFQKVSSEFVQAQRPQKDKDSAT